MELELKRFGAYPKSVFAQSNEREINHSKRICKSAISRPWWDKQLVVKHVNASNFEVWWILGAVLLASLQSMNVTFSTSTFFKCKQVHTRRVGALHFPILGDAAVSLRVLYCCHPSGLFVYERNLHTNQFHANALH